MKKKILPLLLVLGLVLGFGTSASAVNQLPNADVYLGSYSVGPIGSVYSGYCTATQSHINLVINSSKGVVGYIAQYRAPNGSWTNMGTKITQINPKTSSTKNINAVKGNDYRLKITAPISSSGTVTCY